jgi:hypothetical protein
MHYIGLISTAGPLTSVTTKNSTTSATRTTAMAI